MSEFSSWLQANWYGLGNFLVKLACLAAAIWFCRGILKLMRAFQEQVGALLKLTITTAAEREASGASEGSRFAQASPYWLTPSETQPVEGHPAVLSEPLESGPSWLARIRPGIAGAWHGVANWLNAPMTRAEAGPWHRLVVWLRTPAGS